MQLYDCLRYNRGFHYIQSLNRGVRKLGNNFPPFDLGGRGEENEAAVPPPAPFTLFLLFFAAFVNSCGEPLF